MMHMSDQEIWLEVKELLHQMSEGKKSIDDLLKITLQKLQEVKTSDDHPQPSLHE
jgi:hypothetical protein